MQAVQNHGKVSLDQYVGELSRRTAMASDGDLAALVMTEEIKALDQRTEQSLRDVRLTGLARDVISKRLASLRQEQARLRTETKGKDDERRVSKLPSEELAPLQITVNYETGRLEQSSGGELLEGVKDGPGAGEHQVNASVLDSEIRRLEGQQQALDTEREVRMIDLNNMMSKRSNMIQWLSNLTKKRSDTQAGIINNLR
ncbi:MAG: hypothetical protein IPG96_05530 [Proteobacteria bacterium]|jgi:uncharacterized small protein (DUF1192 family)|nr:hypothetical protein [Pseudomonadota bacterium]